MLKDILFFDFLITPWLIRVIYWILQALLIISSIKILIGGNAEIFGSTLEGFLGAMIFLIIGSLILRLITELLVVVFKIAENTQQLKK